MTYRKVGSSDVAGVTRACIHVSQFSAVERVLIFINTIIQRRKEVDLFNFGSK